MNIMAKFFLIISAMTFSTISFGDESYICVSKQNETFPNISTDEINILNKLENRDFDPCQKKITHPQSKKELCLLKAKDFQSILCSHEGMMGFDNAGGLFGLDTGICWWHSQFHRLATYQAYYSPQKKKLNPDNASDKKKIKKIFNHIIRKKGPVEIPGYSSLYEFTKDPKIEALLQKRLQKWMAEDSFLKMQWYKGLTTPENYSKKDPEYYNKDRSRFMFPPMGEKYKNDMIKIAKEENANKEFKSEQARELALKESIDNINKEIEDSKNKYVERLKKNYAKLKDPKKIDKKINSIINKAERAYKRNTYNSDELMLKKKEKTMKHQNAQVAKLFDQVSGKDQVSYITVQNTGIVAHASIVFDAKKIIDPKTGEESYEFKVQDSGYQNDNSSKGMIAKKPYSRLKYKDGKWFMDSYGAGNFSYRSINIKVHHNGQLHKIDELFNSTCHHKLFR